MSHINQRVIVTCPLGQARMRLAQFFLVHGNPNGKNARLALQIDVDVPGRRSPLTLRRSVLATIAPHHLASDMEPRYDVRWSPELSGPFPSFVGELVIEGADDYDSFALHLSGDYTPPMGIVGRGFDSAVGRRVAAATANNLLHRIRNVIERDFQADESRKHLTAL